MKYDDFSPIEYWIDERVKSRVWISQPRESLEHHIRNTLLQKDSDNKEDNDEDYLGFFCETRVEIEHQGTHILPVLHSISW